MPTVYPKFDLAAVKPVEDDIKAALTIGTHALLAVGSGLNLFGADGHLNQHSAAVAEVRAEIAGRSHRGGDLSGKALEDHFTGVPYGWHPTVVRLILAAMFRAGMISAKADNVHYTDHYRAGRSGALHPGAPLPPRGLLLRGGGGDHAG